MAKQAVFTMKLEPELRDAFMAAAKADDRPASQIVRAFMRDYVKQDRDYVEFMRRKVEIARKEIDAGLGISDEDVEAEFSARRDAILRSSREAAE